jgi:predicted MFS family arabinose efflux permease
MTVDAAAPRRFLTAPPDGLIAAVLLSFLATAGLFYVNIMAALVSGLIDGLHFSQKDAGFVAAANVYGAAFGALIAVFAVKHIPWRRAAVVALFGLIAIDLVSTQIATPELLIGTRFLHGVVGGFLVGIAFSVIARTHMPDRVFGMLLIVQFGLGGLGVMFLPGLVPIYGTPILFLALSAVSVITLLMLPFIADYPPRAAAAPGTAAARTRWGPLILTLVCIFLFQFGNMAISAYMIELGRTYGLTLDFISPAIGIAAWMGAIGSIAVVALGTRIGRFKPLLIGLLANVLFNAAFYFSDQHTIFAGANVAGAIGWGFTIPYLLGLASAFDTTGQSATMAGFFSKMGLATGPFVGGLLMAEAAPDTLITVAVLALAASCAALIPAHRVDSWAATKPRA